MFKLEIKLGNDAMKDSGDVAAALDYVSDLLEVAAYQDFDEWRGQSGAIYDANGNKVGRWAIEGNEDNDG
jgi:hypothetical protein